MGDLSGEFICDDAIIERVLGTKIYFGEVLGKHSEIYGDLSRDDLSEHKDVTEDDCKTVIRILGLEKSWEGMDCYTIGGYNPIEYVPEEVEDEETGRYRFNPLLKGLGVKGW